MSRFFPPFIGGTGAVGLLVLRLVAGSAFILHGWGKIQNAFHWMDAMGIPTFLQALGALAEFGGGIAWILGLLTPLASLGILCNMVVALAKVHLPHGDPFVAMHPGQPSFEPALDYLAVAVVLLLVGPGAYSLDAALFGGRRPLVDAAKGRSVVALRPAAERGHAQRGWLDSWHTFSFANYYDPDHMGFRVLRVLNEDRVQPGEGFGSHPHRDMEIITCVLEGALAHRDSTGTGSVLPAGEVQRMSAGTGLTHSEYNASQSEPVHFLPIWILPEREGLAPGYEQRAFPEEERRGRLRPIAAPGARDGALSLHQDAEIYNAVLAPGEKVAHALCPGRHAWVQQVLGSATVNGQRLSAGDGATVSDESALAIAAMSDTEVMVFDLP